MIAHALASTTLTDSPSVSGYFTHCWDFHFVLRVVNSICRCTNLFNFWLVHEFLVQFHTAKNGLVRCCLYRLRLTMIFDCNFKEKTSTNVTPMVVAIIDALKEKEMVFKLRWEKQRLHGWQSFLDCWATPTQRRRSKERWRVMIYKDTL